MMGMAELIYLASARFDRKSRARSATPTSLIIERSRHPFHEKTDAEPRLMGTLEMMEIIILMESRDAVSGRLILWCTSFVLGCLVEGRCSLMLLRCAALHCSSAGEGKPLVWTRLVWDVMSNHGERGGEARSRMGQDVEFYVFRYSR